MDYSGLKLTPARFADILIELFDGKQFERQDAIALAKSFFVEHGGILENRDYAAVFKKASRLLKDKGMVNRGYGIWRINYIETETEIIHNEKKVEEVYTAHKEIGNGSCAVYVYYYDAYKELAQLNGKTVWECKIGRTDKDPVQRVFSQSGTCYPEFPNLALIIYCNDSSKLEAALHSILKYRGKWLENSPGSEWFITSPEEIEQIYKQL